MKQAKTLCIEKPDVGTIAYLHPLTLQDAQDPALVEALTAWRARNRKYFFSQFEPTAMRTKDWLENHLLLDESRVLFLIRGLDNVLYGQYGAIIRDDSSAELDNAILGAFTGPRRLFYFTELTILRWIFQTFPVRTVFARVFSHNAAALHLHSLVGMTVTQSCALEKVSDGETTIYRPTSCASGDPSLSMEVLSITRDTFFARHPSLSLKDMPL